MANIFLDDDHTTSPNAKSAGAVEAEMQTFGRLIFHKPKPMSEDAALLLEELEAQNGFFKDEDPLANTPEYVAESAEADDLLARIESEMAAAKTVVKYTGGGFAVPFVQCIGAMYNRQNRRTQWYLVMIFVVVSIAFYFAFYEEEEEIEEEIEETIEEEGISFSGDGGAHHAGESISEKELFS